MTKKAYRRKQRQKPEAGQSLLEFALTLPLLIILLVAMVVVAWVGFSYISITNAARMGTRWMLNYPLRPQQNEPLDPAAYDTVDEEIMAVIIAAMPVLDTSETTMQIGIQPQPSTARGQNVQVSVTITYTVNLPTVTLPYVLADGEITLSRPLQLVSQSRMRIE